MPEKIRDLGTMPEKKRRSRHAAGDNKGDPDTMSERIGKQIRESTEKRVGKVLEKGLSKYQRSQNEGSYPSEYRRIRSTRE